MICEHFRAIGAHEAGLDLSDLFIVSLRGDDYQDFDTRWDQAPFAASEIPKEMSWRVCARCEYESLFSFRPCWQ